MEECFAELSSHIYALETGLSSDPAMNWMCSQLDKYLLVSNSDAHSPSKLGRESNIFDCDITAESIFHALRTGQGFCGTMEFYPEESKYHLDGHRKCQVRMSPEETLQQNGICPVCGKPVTLGVLYRVLELADRKFGERPENALPYSSIIPLESILSEIFEVGVSSKKVQQEYFRLLKLFGSELDILQNVDLEILEKKNSAIFAEAIRRVRQGNIVLQGGYDGEFGIVKIFENSEKKEFLPCLFVEGIGNISNQKEKALPKSKNVKNISKQEEKEL
ncbi:MAG TPA: endonuclease Q family protein, partial [Planctomycetota bacterium]|nr:endonuclease Q family protein [Planctomycetota bacterium]